jgi:hypothetical protein
MWSASTTPGIQHLSTLIVPPHLYTHVSILEDKTRQLYIGVLGVDTSGCN